MITCNRCKNLIDGKCEFVTFAPISTDYCSKGEKIPGSDPWDAVIEIAKGEVGYQESGYNITKYAKHFDTNHPEFYHGVMQGQAWCGIFVDWCFEMAYGFETMKKMLFRPDTQCRSCGVKEAYKYYDKNKHMMHGKDPRVGDQVMFGQTFPYYTYDHTGLIISVEDNTHYTTIEGNYQNGVNIVKRVYSQAIGWGRPDWEIVS